MEVLFIIIGILIGWYGERVLWELGRIRNAMKPKPKTGIVTPDVARPIRSSTNIISPKTPSRMQYEMDMEMKRQAGLIE